MGFVFKMSRREEFSHCATIRGNNNVCRLLSHSSIPFSSFTIQGFQKMLKCVPLSPTSNFLGLHVVCSFQVSLTNVYKHFLSSHVCYMSSSSHNYGNCESSQYYGVLPIEQLHFPEYLNSPSLMFVDPCIIV
jgi:hypothetical protein